MVSPETPPETKRRDEIDAEAAAWLFRLQDDDRTAHTDAAFQAWLKADPAHETAFQQVTDLWEILPGATAFQRQPANDVPRRKAQPQRRTFAIGIAAAVAAAAFVLGGIYLSSARTEIYETGVGQQHVATLADGSQLALNTDSKVLVTYHSDRRHLELVRGEAMFDVAHNPQRPFTVLAGQEQVKALGTSFVVRREPNHLWVTLVRGKVELSNRVTSADGGSDFRPQVILAPGERATVDGAGNLMVDRPSVSAMVAWRQGEVVFKDTTILDAANELNRYGATKIVVTDAVVARTRVSGLFKINRPADFATAVAELNGVRVRRTASAIELTR
ncbi:MULTISPECIES: FecR family protein [Asticcacaulis]|uniref:FecR family protein n=1 Tax=Asticcacaulis TaxID=76890 RepID=UPI001AE7C1EC|nr:MULTISPECIES: FecR family protein [Asticcacaulis]MBP2159305.1 transmembrane sensor [Asticcacaulis solisilvae]MDR6800350.1 transmembrane sensor [Asticcacaulis sp. BE141]